jgi:hypothetical protein
MTYVRRTLSAFLFATFSVATAQVIQNDAFWKDTSGDPICSLAGGVLKVGTTYYWYGTKYAGAVTYYNNPSGGKNNNTTFVAITCYSSSDLVHWKFEGNALTSSDVPGWVGGVGIAYHATTRNYVLLAQSGGGIIFATSKTPTGHFTMAGTQASITNLANGMSGDQTVFTDEDGKAYLICSNKNGRSHLYVAPLRSSDYLQVEAATNIYNSSAGGREGNLMFNHNGTYYFCSSDLHGWNASHTYCITSKNILGPYSSEFVLQGTEPDFTHVTQSGFAFSVNGTSGSFVMFVGDRWSDFAGNDLGFTQWVPISFNGTTPIFNSLSQWNVNAAAGTWSVGSGNNYVLNPGFEADRVSQTNLAGWTNTSNLSTDPNGNTSASHSPGRWAMAQSNSSAYQASMYQTISLPNGIYSLSAWVKSSGGQNKANLFARNFGGNELYYSINKAIGAWTQVNISNIHVTNGTIQVGIFSDAKAGNWVNTDDFSLIRTDAPVVTDITEDQSDANSAQTVYPSPTRGEANWKGEQHWILLTTLGNELSKGHGTSVDLSGYSRGTYLLKLGDKIYPVVKE